MKRFFSNANVSSSLEGHFQCSYCSEPHADWRRFQLFFVNGIPSEKLSFCTPECAVAYNKYMTVADDNQATRYKILQETYQRRIDCAPNPVNIKLTRRAEWLPCARFFLSEAEQKVAQKELEKIKFVKNEWCFKVSCGSHRT